VKTAGCITVVNDVMDVKWSDAGNNSSSDKVETNVPGSACHKAKQDAEAALAEHVAAAKGNGAEGKSWTKHMPFKTGTNLFRPVPPVHAAHHWAATYAFRITCIT
jgi:hypothetical protein